MPRPLVLDIDPNHIPEGSLAETAARVRFGSGAIGVVELFREGDTVDFRGLPTHLANGDNMQIEINHELGMEDGATRPTTTEEHDRLTALQNQLLFEFAVGARQHLWDGAAASYSGPSFDPASIHYKPYLS